ncbi:DUF4249 domain-containing protein [Flavobacterium cerinum]|uniref:DUF4249 domain-containing protein n=1 Tax=Flavobacterium cerinum TaxID=2502784 RepID=A0A3S3Q9Y1_9FLAO|nr:DUF4249 domain-containing protein [Flavobacterium cerinum]RWX01631.1 DUF4249 domain-containing protein [Flavobacterium cerinum]
MKKVLFILSLILSLLFISCEEVVHIDMDTAEPKLVVDASLNWLKGSKGNYQVIKLSTTTSFYSKVIPPVAGATVYITNPKGRIFRFKEFEGYEGSYVCDYFLPVINQTYTLTVVYNDQTYTAIETMLPVPDLLDVDQQLDGSIIDKDLMTIKAYFNDPAGENNFYLNRFIRNGKTGQSAVFNDRFVNGNYTNTVRIFDDLVKDDQIRIELYGISSQHYDYMSKIFSMISEGNKGPFEVPPSQVRGNMINQSAASNFAYGYFRLSQVSTIEYVVR